MLTKLKSIFTAFLVVCFSATLYAADRISYLEMNWDESRAWEENGLWFTIDPAQTDKGCAVLLPKHQTAGQTQNISIPQYSRGFEVVAILGSAFRNNTSVTSVQIPNTVRGIEPGAFAGAVNLSAVNIDSQNAHYTTIGGVVFSADRTQLILWPAALTDVNWDNNTLSQIRTDLSHIADWSCAYVKEFPRNIFRSLYNIQYIGNYAFYNSRLTGISSSRIENIGNHSFDGCKDLTAFSMTNIIKSIGDYALARSGVQSGTINFYDDSQYIGKGIYAECKQLKSFSANMRSENPSIRILNDSCCYGCDILETVSCRIPALGRSSFEGCVALKNVTLYEQVTEIQSKAFSGCSGMSSISSYNPVPPAFAGDAFTNVPKSCLLTVRADYIEAYRSSPWNNIFTMLPEEVKIGNLTYHLNAKDLWAYCTYYDGTETEVTIPANITVCGMDFMVYSAIGNVALNSRNILRKVNLPSTVTQIGGFYGCSELTEINFPDNLIHISNDAFTNCVKLGNPTIPASVEFIGNNPYRGCTSITSINVAEGNKAYVSHNGDLYSIDGTQLIATPSSRSSVTVREGTVRIAPYACAGSPNLKTIIIPASVLSMNMAYSIFIDCPALENINVAKENNLYHFSNGGLYAGIPGESVLVAVPQSFKTIVVNEGTYLIDSNAFLQSPVLESIDIPATVTRITASAFGNCKALKSVTCRGNTPPVCEWREGMENTIDVSKATLYVPAGASGEYRKEPDMLWSRFGSIIELSSSSIDSVDTDDSNAPVEYFNMHGMRVENPSSGIFIRRQGNTVTKVMIH